MKEYEVNIWNTGKDPRQHLGHFWKASTKYTAAYRAAKWFKMKYKPRDTVGSELVIRVKRVA